MNKGPIKMGDSKSTLRREIIKSKESKKLTVTFAIDEKILNELRNDAEFNGISLNSKINNILTKYVTFYKHAEEIVALYRRHLCLVRF